MPFSMLLLMFVGIFVSDLAVSTWSDISLVGPFLLVGSVMLSRYSGPANGTVGNFHIVDFQKKKIIVKALTLRLQCRICRYLSMYLF